MRICIAIMLASIALMPLATCTPVGHLTGNYNATTGEVSGGVDVELRRIKLQREIEARRFLLERELRRLDAPAERCAKAPCE